MNRFLDLCNGRNNEKGITVGNISSDHLRPLEELAGILKWFWEWHDDLHSLNLEKAEMNKAWFAAETWQAFRRVVICMVALPAFYLPVFPRAIIVQRRLSSDCLEHHFGQVRSKVQGGMPSVLAGMRATHFAAMVAVLRPDVPVRNIRGSNVRLVADSRRRWTQGVYSIMVGYRACGTRWYRNTHAG